MNQKENEQPTEAVNPVAAPEGTEVHPDAPVVPEAPEEVDEVAVKALITEAITKKVDELSVTDKISAAASEVAKTLGEQRKAVNVIKTTDKQDQANVKSFFRAVLSNDQAALKALNTGTNGAGG